MKELEVKERARHEWCIAKHILEASEAARELVSDATDEGDAELAARVSGWLAKLEALCLDICSSYRYSARVAEVLRGLLHAERHARERAAIANDEEEREGYIELVARLRELRKEFVALVSPGGEGGG